MIDNAASGRASDDDPVTPETGSTPPIADFTDRPAPAPGPLTKPAPVIRPAKRRPRWIVPVIVVALLAAAVGAVIIWQAALSGLG